MMQVLAFDREQILNDGFTIVDDIYTVDEIGQIIKLIDETDQSNIFLGMRADYLLSASFCIRYPK